MKKALFILLLFTQVATAQTNKDSIRQARIADSILRAELRTKKLDSLIIFHTNKLDSLKRIRDSYGYGKDYPYTPDSALPVDLISPTSGTFYAQFSFDTNPLHEVYVKCVGCMVVGNANGTFQILYNK
jgi:hypothetical protein